jgi:hypothetical protein
MSAVQGAGKQRRRMNKRRVLGFAIFSLVALVIAAFATGNVSLPSVMEIFNCKEMFSRYNIDAELARRAVPSDMRLKVNQAGEALMLVMVQECEKMVLDSLIDVGAVGMSHIWIEIEGPEEYVDPLPGTTRSLPTRYWFILPHQLDNQLARFFFGLVGVDAEYVREVTLGGDPLDKRSGAVLEFSPPGGKYSWTESIQPYSEEEIVTGSQRFYREYGLRSSEAEAKCESHFLGDSQVNLVVSSSSSIGELGIGTALVGVSNPVFVQHCHVNYRVHFFRPD